MKNYTYHAEYKAEVANYQKRDGIFALCLFLFYCVMGFLLGVMRANGINPLVSGLIFVLIAIVAVIVLVLTRKDGISSIGFRKKNIGSALRLGLLFGLIPVLMSGGLIPGLIIYNWEFHAISAIIINTFVTFLFAAHEDMIFVGYIQTRLYGLIKRDYLAILTGALLFSLMHIMPQLGLHGFEAFNFQNLIWLIAIIPMHIFLNALFRRYSSIYPVVIFHTLNNGAANMWVSPDSYLLGRGNIIVLGIYTVAFTVWILFLRQKEKAKLK